MHVGAFWAMMHARMPDMHAYTQPTTYTTHGTQRLRALVPPCRRLPKLLVLDLNGFLVHRVFIGDGGTAGACVRRVRACVACA